MHLTALFMVLLLLGLPPASGPPAPSPSGMRALEFLAGQWEGKGTMTFGPNRVLEARASEHVEYRLGGAAMVIEGRGTAERDGREVVVHSALAVISWDSTTNKYDMRTWRVNGGTLTPDLEVADRRLTWAFDDPRAGRIRFTVTVDSAGYWNEVGEYSRNGGDWTPFFQMRLARQGSK